ncbi:hypothetical protein CHS0354_003818 [Potamilus streckersoni]|uniref:Uncharacterized protein n=1 Tax=Potamilus streckersoni TaxID=2493646 RepID=A0AAE0SFX3_9BIVA|nr:hypothetical protein CHS0354_003818 [Potamilus streckersoni]
MMHMSLIFMSVVLLHCVQLQRSINTTEESIKSQYFNNQTEHYPSFTIDPFSFPIWTAGNTLCRVPHICNFHQSSSYKWCYTDYSDSWDYCCAGSCGFDRATYMWCQTGTEWTYCGGNKKHDIQGRPCLESFPCGLHPEITGKSEKYYWCYVDLFHNWDYCCAPWNICDKRGSTYHSCYVYNSADASSNVLKECVPIK